MKTLLVTGRLAEPALRAVLGEVQRRPGDEYDVAVLPISVAALMTPRWVARHLAPGEDVCRVVLPGHCGGDLAPIRELTRAVIDIGPLDLRDLPSYLTGEGPLNEPTYGAYDIEVLAEINHAPSLTLTQLLLKAERHRRDGADVIDLGCTPGHRWTEVADAVKALKDQGFRVSIDSFDPGEVADAVSAGAELVLSVNASNRDRAADWGVEVVVIPDEPHSLEGLRETTDYLGGLGVPHRIDPVLDPIGFGFAASLGRYIDARRLFPGHEIMMGIGNLTELTDVDSAGVNTLLVGACQELAVRSVLTTEVINWARTSVREIDLARRLMFHAVNQKVLPKHREPGLVALRDPKLSRFGPEVLGQIASRIKDKNWRLYAEDGRIVAMNGNALIEDDDPFRLFERMNVVDPGHAFYLGYELMKARTALTLGKNYRQDQALEWGHLTVPEESHLARKSLNARTRGVDA